MSDTETLTQRRLQPASQDKQSCSFEALCIRQTRRQWKQRNRLSGTDHTSGLADNVESLIRGLFQGKFESVCNKDILYCLAGPSCCRIILHNLHFRVRRVVHTAKALQTAQIWPGLDYSFARMKCNGCLLMLQCQQKKRGDSFNAASRDALCLEQLHPHLRTLPTQIRSHFCSISAAVIC